MTAPPRVLLEDRSLPHQIVLHTAVSPDPYCCSPVIAVSCTCLRSGRGHVPLAARDRWDSVAEQVAIWKAHLPG